MSAALEEFLGHDLQGRPRRFGATLRRAVGVLRRLRVPHAIAGSVAYGLQVDEVQTRDVDFLVEPADFSGVVGEFERAGFEVLSSDGESLAHLRDPETGVKVDLMYGVGDPEESALESAQDNRLRIFGTAVPTVNPDYLLWMFLLSPHGRHRDRAVEMIRRGRADAARVSARLRYDGDAEALELLEKYVRDAEHDAAEWHRRKR